MTHRPILILGGGLSGLYTAHELERRGVDYRLLEARNRLGGRILSIPGGDEAYDPGKHAFDLGPAWFWPGQRRMAELIRELGLADRVFEQYADGDALWEAAPGIVRRGDFGASMAGSYRLRGGLSALVHALARDLPKERIRLGSRIARLALDGEDVRATVVDADGESEVIGRSAVVALPPRLAVATLNFAPELSPDRRAELEAVPTWMAGSAKTMALYDRPFWRRNGLSGDAFSHVGPLGEIHDASPPDGGPYALFGFFAAPPEARERYRDRLREVCLDQLTRLFGEPAGHPRELHLRDWAFDPLTAVAADRRGPAVHSLQGLENTESWDGRLLWSGSESASPAERHNGYLEGALEAGARTVERLMRS